MLEDNGDFVEIARRLENIAYVLHPDDRSIAYMRLGLDRGGELRSPLDTAVALEISVSDVICAEARILAVIRLA